PSRCGLPEERPGVHRALELVRAVPCRRGESVAGEATGGRVSVSLLPQPGGFEGFFSATAKLDPDDLAVANLPHRTRDEFDLGLRVVPAGTVPDEDDDPIARIDHFVNSDVIGRPGLKPVEPELPESVDSNVGGRAASLPHGHGLNGWVDQRFKSRSGLLEEAVVAKERGDVGIGRWDQRLDYLDVLLRHRPRSISRRDALLVTQAALWIGAAAGTSAVLELVKLVGELGLDGCVGG